MAFLPDGGSPVATTTNFSLGATATATSTYVGYGPERLNDDDEDTSWFSDTGICALPVATDFLCCPPLSATVTFAQDRAVRAIEIRGNREFSSGYDILRARIELLTAAGAVASSVNATFSGPTRDFAYRFPASVNARAVRVVVLAGEGGGPGFAELRVWP